MSNFIVNNKFLTTESGAPTLLGALLLLIWGGIVFLVLMGGLAAVVVLLGLGLHAVHLVMASGVSLGTLIIGGFLIIFIIAALHGIWCAYNRED